MSWKRCDHDGDPTDPTGAAAAATEFYDQLPWWARTLRSARVEAVS